MKRFFDYLHYKWDYVIGYIMCNPRYLHRYHIWMHKKWGERYCTKQELKDYFNSREEKLDG